MIGWIIRLMLVFLIITIAYVILDVYGRVRERQRLTAEFDAEAHTEDRGEFIAKGLRDYDRSAKPKLILAVYGVPFVTLGILLYLAHL